MGVCITRYAQIALIQVFQSRDRGMGSVRVLGSPLLHDHIGVAFTMNQNARSNGHTSGVAHKHENKERQTEHNNKHEQMKIWIQTYHPHALLLKCKLDSCCTRRPCSILEDCILLGPNVTRMHPAANILSANTLMR